MSTPNTVNLNNLDARYVSFDGTNLKENGAVISAPAGSLNGIAISGTPAVGNSLIATSTSAAAWSATRTVDTTNTPQGPSASPTPGTGSNGVSASDHVHPLPTSAQLVSTLSAGGVSLIAPLWQSIASGEITLPRGHEDDSGSYGSTPASGTVHYTYFMAQKSASRSTIRFQTGSTAQATNTYSNVGIYSVNTSTGALTLLASATQKALSGTYAGQTFTLASAVSLAAGTMYAVGFLQVATTVASVLGTWFNGAYLGATPQLAMTGATGLSTLPASGVQPTTTTQFPIYYEIL